MPSKSAKIVETIRKTYEDQRDFEEKFPDTSVGLALRAATALEEALQILEEVKNMNQGFGTTVEVVSQGRYGDQMDLLGTAMLDGLLDKADEPSETIKGKVQRACSSAVWRAIKHLSQGAPYESNGEMVIPEDSIEGSVELLMHYHYAMKGKYSYDV